VIVNARSGERAPQAPASAIELGREDWNSVTDQLTGQPNTSMDEGFSTIETTVLHRIKSVRIGSVTPEQAGAIVNLFAVHLARSRSFRQWQSEGARRVDRRTRPRGCRISSGDRRVRDAVWPTACAG
jgi:hypothetical protein